VYTKPAMHVNLPDVAAAIVLFEGALKGAPQLMGRLETMLKSAPFKVLNKRCCPARKFAVGPLCTLLTMDEQEEVKGWWGWWGWW
jgi:hypothetical protein